MIKVSPPDGGFRILIIEKSVSREIEMEYLYDVEIVLPLPHLLLYIIIVTLCFLFARTKLGFTLNFIFVFYLGFIQNRTLIRDALEGSHGYTALYFVSGAVLLTFALISFFRSDSA